MTKTKILLATLVVLATLSIAATTAVTIVQPQRPSVTIVKDFRAIYGLEKDMKAYIDEKVSEGYIVKSVSMMDDETFSKGIVVMEKY